MMAFYATTSSSFRILKFCAERQSAGPEGTGVPCLCLFYISIPAILYLANLSRKRGCDGLSYSAGIQLVSLWLLNNSSSLFVIVEKIRCSSRNSAIDWILVSEIASRSFLILFNGMTCSLTTSLLFVVLEASFDTFSLQTIASQLALPDFLMYPFL